MACEVEGEDIYVYPKTSTPILNREVSSASNERITLTPNSSPVSSRPNHWAGSRTPGNKRMRSSSSSDTLANMCKLLSIDERTVLQMRRSRSRRSSYPTPPPTPTELGPQIQHDPRLRELARGLDKIFSNNHNNNNNDDDKNCQSAKFRRQNTK